MEKESIIFSGVVIFLGYYTGISSGDLKQYVDTLRIKYKNAIIPSNFVFPIVWSILYYFYGYFMYKVWNEKLLNFLSIFGLILNYLWTFFFLKNRFTSLLIIILQVIVAIITISNLTSNFLKLFQLVYLSWLIFALILNYQVL